MKRTKLLFLAYVIGFLIFNFNSGCRKDPPNKSPIANAGLDQTIMKPRNNTLLTGELSRDADGRIDSYQWTSVAGPNTPDMNNDRIGNFKHYEKFVSNLEQGVYQFELMVVDNDGATARDTVKVTVLSDLLTGDPSHMKRFDSLYWVDSCTIPISNISSVIPVTGSFQVFMASYYGGGPMSSFVPSSGWFQLQPVRSSSYWYEIKNNVLIIHAAANIDCGWDDSLYDVLIKWN